MDQLRQFISHNREAFETGELPAGHLIRFNRKLDRKQTQKNRNRWFLYSLITGCAAIGFLVFLIRSQTNHTGSAENCTTVAELREVQLYYHIQLNQVLKQIQETAEIGGNTLEKRQILQEAARIFSQQQDFEEKIIPQLPCDENTVFVIDQYYSTTLRTFRFMLSRLEKNEQL